MSSVWKECVEHLKGELSPQEFSTWIMPLQARQEGAQLRLFAPNRFVRDWVRDHYGNQIEQLCNSSSNQKVTGVQLEVGALVKNTGNAISAKTPDSREQTDGLAGDDRLMLERRRASNLSAEFRFDTFVEGKSNQIARAASLQIASNPGVSYNPLFIYGGVGLGKTHLMQAVGNTILDRNEAASILYVHSERFVSDMIKALQHNRMDEFKARYRAVNALLIDDVQFFAGKDRSQEEFFHTFNALFDTGQQIILSSDRFPKEVAGLEERLRSRFGWGLTVAIEPPDLETRVAILQSKASLFGIELPEEVAFFVAKRLRSNVRELEGALRRLGANSRFTGVPINLEFARTALHDMLIAQDKQVTIENIQKVVAAYYKIRTADLLSAKRTRSITRPRQIAMTLAKELTKNSLPEIGKAFGGRDHSTVIHAAKKIAELRVADALIDEDCKNLLRTLTS
ncbi:chromosomal replication initiator protein DnaA [Thiorhodovibrio frisius]|uniref:Chromosomal replication initiator protein DnaA n=1 Tax=Thiorhodovibrio frisius TaxID=631362 RepID=H8Z1G8_9GAMM|nr:chromosomal replication initiator protein DnaA [Thiorhodovibrio frisius]EIC22517.1 chromosomal replication initiator protein DnaA [Thiorhodovibrio frisius]WPL19956.1 Chromosomal replication initiator protein DnaA [Thiorhodovibrio frisius]